MHGIAAITGNMHRSLRYFVLLELITSIQHLWSGGIARRGDQLSCNRGTLFTGARGHYSLVNCTGWGDSIPCDNGTVPEDSEPGLILLCMFISLLFFTSSTIPTNFVSVSYSKHITSNK